MFFDLVAAVYSVLPGRENRPDDGFHVSMVCSWHPVLHFLEEKNETGFAGVEIDFQPLKNESHTEVGLRSRVISNDQVGRTKPQEVEQFYEGNEGNRTIYRDNTLMLQVNPIKLLERETEREREVPLSALFLILLL